MNKQGKHFYEFERFRVDGQERVLLRDGRPVYLPPKVFDTLLALVEHSGHIIEKEELMRAVWPETFVEESNLTQYISVLRRTLGDERHEPRYIETIPRRGYRFAASVQEVWDETAELVSATHTKISLVVKEETEDFETGDREAGRRGDRTKSFRRISPPPRLFLLAALALLVSLGVAAVWVVRLRDSEDAREKMPVVRSIAVLPFSTIGESDAEKLLGLGMADAVIGRLGRVEQIVVRPTSAVHKYADTLPKTAFDANTWFSSVAPHHTMVAGRELGVDLVLHGAVERAGERVKVTAQLVNAMNQAPLWVERYEEDFMRVFVVHERIAERVIDTVAPALVAQRQNLPKGRHTESAEAYEAYLFGLFLWNRRTNVDVRHSVKYFQTAILKDPDFALAHVGLAAACSMSWECGPEAEPTARKALALDPTLGEAHAVVGFVRMFQQMKLGEAEAEFKRAVELSPNHAPAHQWLALCLAAQGRTEEAQARMRRALEIDPHSLVINADYGQVLYFAKEYDQAIEQCRKTLKMDPNFLFAHIYLYQVYTKKMMYDEAIDEYFQIYRLSFTDTAPIEPLRMAYASGGIRGFWRAVTNDSLDSVIDLARHYTYLGEKEQALDWLKKASEDNDGFQFIFLNVDPAFEDLHADPRFHELVRRVIPHDR